MRKITEKESEDQLDVGCTNEAGCMIHDKQCASSGDCTSSCCESDLCNSGLSSKTCAISSSLLITGYFVISLLLWVPSVHQDIFQEKNKEGKFSDKNSRQQVKVIIINLRLSSVRGLGDTWAEFTGVAVTAKGLSSDPVEVKRKRNKIWSVYSDAFFFFCLGQKTKCLLLSVSGILKKETRKELAQKHKDPFQDKEAT